MPTSSPSHYPRHAASGRRPPPDPHDIHPALWRASQLTSGGRRRLRSGQDLLDQALGGGWPLGALTELLPTRAGIGEIRLLQPALLRLLADGHLIILLNPPHAPSMQCWTSWGLDPSRVAWVRTRSPAETAWAAHQILHHAHSAVLLCWAERLPYPDSLKLHRLARRSALPVILFRPPESARIESPAPTRISLHPSSSGLNLYFLKNLGAPAAAKRLTLNWHDLALDQSAPVPASIGRSGTAPTPVAFHTEAHSA